MLNIMLVSGIFAMAIGWFVEALFSWVRMNDLVTQRKAIGTKEDSLWLRILGSYRGQADGSTR